MSRYSLTLKARGDLEAIGDFIAEDNPRRAVALIEELLELCDRITETPRAFRRRDDLVPGLRQAIHGRYLILFTPRDDHVVIERVVHSARRLEDLL